MLPAKMRASKFHISHKQFQFIINMFLKGQACFLFRDSQEEVRPSIFSWVVLCFFVFWFILQGLFCQSVCLHPLYILWPLFLVLFSFLQCVLSSSFLHKTLILSLSSFVIQSRCLKNFICAASIRYSSLFFSTQASLTIFSAPLAVML